MVLLRGEFETINGKVTKLPPEQMKGSHWFAADLERRYKNYSDTNDLAKFQSEKDEERPTVRFFQEHKTEVFEVDCDGDNYEMLESMRIYIERHGRPYNYLVTVDELNEERDTYLQEQEMNENNEAEARRHGLMEREK